MIRVLKQMRSDVLSATVVLVTVFSLFHLELYTPGHKPSKISQFFQELEYQTFDYRMRARNRLNPPKVGGKVVVLTIDDESLAQYGRWPWPRRFHAQIARTLASLGVRSILFDVEFPEPSDPIVASDTTGESIDQTIKHVHNILQALFDPATLSQRFASDIAAGMSRLPDILGALRDQVDIQIEQIATAFNRVTVQPDTVLADAFRDAIKIGTKVFGVFFFEDAPTQEAIEQNALLERAFQFFTQDPDLAFRDVNLARALGVDNLKTVMFRAKAYRLLRERFDSSDKEIADQIGAHGTASIDWARDRILRECSERVIGQFPDRTDDELIERVLKCAGSARALTFARQTRKFVRDAHARWIVRERDTFPIHASETLHLEDFLEITAPVPVIAGAFSGVGFSTVLQDSDGKLRRASLMMRYHGGCVVQAMVQPVLDLLGVKREALRVDGGKRLVLPGARMPDGSTRDVAVPIDAYGQTLVNWAGPWEEGRIPVLSIGNVMQLMMQELKHDEQMGRSAEMILNRDRMRIVEAAKARDPKRLLTAKEAFNAEDDTDPKRQTPEEWEKYLQGERLDYDQHARRMLELAVERFKMISARVKQADDLAQKQRSVDLAKASTAQDRAKINQAADQGRLKRAQAQENFGALIAQNERDLDEFWRIPENLRKRLQALLKGKIVIVGATAIAATDYSPNPLQEKFPKVMVHANLINMITTGQFLQRLDSVKIELPVWGAMAFIAATTIGPVGFGAGLLIFVLLVLAYGLVATWLLVWHGLWIEMLGPELILFLTAFSIANRKFWQEERAKNRIRAMFETYLDPKVVHVLVADERLWRELGGTERQITAFFSDLESFTSLSEMLTPEQVSQMLTAYLSPMTRIILDHEGMKDKYIGDAVVGIFGAPVPSEDHALQACLASLEQQRRLEEMRREWEAAKVPWYVTIRARGHDLRARIGLNSGPAKVGNFGSEDSKNYTMIGDTVNLASRLEGANKEFHTFTMISESTYAMARGAIEARELDRLRVKGKLEPVTVYEPMGVRGKVPDRVLELVSIFHQGLALYRERRFDEALACFQKAIAIDPRDGPSLTYVLRCSDAEFRASVGPDWDGVFEMKHK